MLRIKNKRPKLMTQEDSTLAKLFTWVKAFMLVYFLTFNEYALPLFPIYSYEMIQYGHKRKCIFPFKESTLELWKRLISENAGKLEQSPVIWICNRWAFCLRMREMSRIFCVRRHLLFLDLKNLFVILRFAKICVHAKRAHTSGYSHQNTFCGACANKMQCPSAWRICVWGKRDQGKSRDDRG